MVFVTLKLLWQENHDVSFHSWFCFSETKPAVCSEEANNGSCTHCAKYPAIFGGGGSADCASSVTVARRHRWMTLLFLPRPLRSHAQTFDTLFLSLVALKEQLLFKLAALHFVLLHVRATSQQPCYWLIATTLWSQAGRTKTDRCPVERCIRMSGPTLSPSHSLFPPTVGLLERRVLNWWSLRTSWSWLITNQIPWMYFWPFLKKYLKKNMRPPFALRLSGGLMG